MRFSLFANSKDRDLYQSELQAIFFDSNFNPPYSTIEKKYVDQEHYLDVLIQLQFLWS